MNLLLLSETEAREAEVMLRGRRAEHIFQVLKCAPGAELRAGVLNHGFCTATVVASAATEIRIVLGEVIQAPAPLRKTLLLAMPRPKVLSRCLQHAAALGFTEIRLFRTRRVEKAHLLSHKAQLSDQQQHLRLGLEQSRRVHLPQLSLHERFRPFVEDELLQLLAPGPCFVAHPDAATPTARLPRFNSGYSVALGPEGGFVPFELALLEQAGFLGISCGSAPLRVESALSYITGQLDLLASAA